MRNMGSEITLLKLQPHLPRVNELKVIWSLQWCHNECNGVSNHPYPDCLFNHLFRRNSKKTSKLRVTDLYEGNLSVTGGFPSLKASIMENVSIWWCHHDVKPQQSLNCGLISLPLTFRDWTNLVQQSKYHGWWCPGSLHCQNISTHDIDYVE